MFTGEAQVGEEHFEIELARTGTSAHGHTGNLENPRLETQDSADASKVVIAADPSDPFKVRVDPAADLDVSAGVVAVPMVARYDGRPGEGDVEITDPGLLSFRSPDSSAPGPVTVNTVANS